MSFDRQQPYAAAPPAAPPAPPAPPAPAPYAPGASFVLGAPGPSGPSGGGSGRKGLIAVAGGVVGVAVVLGALVLTRAERAAEKPVTPVAQAPKKATRDDVKSTLKNLLTAEEVYFTDHEKYTTSLAALKAEGFTPSAGVTPKVLRADRKGYCVSAAGAGIVVYFDSVTGRAGHTSCA